MFLKKKKGGMSRWTSFFFDDLTIDDGLTSKHLKKKRNNNSAQAILRDHPSAFGAAADALDGGLDARDSWVERLSWSPRATLHHAFLTRAECDHLISLAKPHMEPSTVVDNVSGERQPSKVRTSSGMFLERGVDEVVSRIEEKIAAASGVPVSHGEGLQVMSFFVFSFFLFLIIFFSFFLLNHKVPQKYITKK